MPGVSLPTPVVEPLRNDRNLSTFKTPESRIGVVLISLAVSASISAWLISLPLSAKRWLPPASLKLATREPGHRAEHRPAAPTGPQIPAAATRASSPRLRDLFASQ